MGSGTRRGTRHLVPRRASGGSLAIPAGSRPFDIRFARSVSSDGRGDSSLPAGFSVVDLDSDAQFLPVSPRPLHSTVASGVGDLLNPSTCLEEKGLRPVEPIDLPIDLLKVPTCLRKQPIDLRKAHRPA